MVGISYSGLSQFPAAGTDPPGLAAIAPMSPTDDLFSTGYPGGIYNDGFAASWIASRIDDAMAAATYSDGPLAQSSPTPVANVGQPWTYYEIDAELAASGGTSTCLANQALHDQSESLASLVGPQIGGARHRTGARPVPLRPPLDDRLGQPYQGAGLPVRRPPGRADRTPVAGADRRHPEDHAGVRQHGQRRPHRLDRPPDASAAGSSSSTSTWPARSPPSPAPWPPPSSTSSPAFASGVSGPGAPAGHPVHRCAERRRGPGRVRAGRPRWCGSCSTTAPDRPDRAPSSRPTRRTSPVGRQKGRSRRSTSDAAGSLTAAAPASRPSTSPSPWIRGHVP